MTHLVLSDLLNPVELRPSTPPRPELVNVREELDEIALATTSGPVFVSPRTQQGLLRALGRLRTIPHSSLPSPARSPDNGPTTPNRLSSMISSAPLPLPPTPSPQPHLSMSIRHNVVLNRKTTLSTLYTYPLHTYLEYPETTASGVVGHLFAMDPDQWLRPSLSFVYSLGRPSGFSKKGDIIYCPLLVDKGGDEVPCFESHSTCM